MFKKITSILLMLVMLFTFTSCLGKLPESTPRETQSDTFTEKSTQKNTHTETAEKNNDSNFETIKPDSDNGGSKESDSDNNASDNNDISDNESIPEDSTESEKQYTYPNLSIEGISIDKYSIIVPKNASQKELSAANEISLWIKENSGIALRIRTDSAEASENEIIIGKANRTECADLDPEKICSYAATINRKLILYAGSAGNYADAIKAFTDNAAKNNGSIKNLDFVVKPVVQEKKKAIFIGNSFIYWGGCVTFITNDTSNEAIRKSGGDKGYFNEICKANGMDVDVYNYTYGGQNLNWIYENKLNSLSNSFLDDIDYVFISEAGENSSSFKSSFNKVASLFKNAEEIVYLAHAYTYSTNATHIIDALPDLAKSGVKIVAWGELVTDVYNGKVSVPNATLKYSKNTFIKNMSTSESMDPRAAVTSLSGKGDSFHQNPLSGYITAQMCFSAITGISAVGQRYDFCWDKTIAPQYDLNNFLTYQYGKNQTSNFINVFNSPNDMKGLQTLMDSYIAKHI